MSLLKIGDIVQAVGYQHLEKEDKKKNLWPSFLRKGTHRITRVRKDNFGLLVQTNRQQIWMNSNWFKLNR
jgi:hypothetical protein